MKRTLASFTALWALAGTLASCSDSEPSPQEPSKETTTGEGPKSEQPQPDSSGESSEDPGAAIDCNLLEPTGNDPGEIPVDLVRMASNGKELSLRSYCNETLLVLNGTAFWSKWDSAPASLAAPFENRPGDGWDWSGEEATRAAAAIAHFKDAKVRMFFLLHTNHAGKPMSSVQEAADWDEEFKFNEQGMTLIDGDRLGTNKWFDGAQAASMVLKPGFVIHSVNPKDFIAAIQAALDEGQ